MKTKSNLNPRKLLKATAGLAAVSYLGITSCGGEVSSGNLMAPAGTGGEQTTGADSGGNGDGTGGYYSSGNLVAPYYDSSGGNGAGGYYSSGNLVAPYYPDCDTDGVGGVGGAEDQDCWLPE